MNFCVHCDELAASPLYQDDDRDLMRPFCCEGCLTVYTILHSKGLESYYDLKNNSAAFKRRSPVELRPDQFNYLDDPDFLREFSYVDHYGHQTMEFYLEGIHCLACLWLIEKLPDFVHGIQSTRLDLDRSVVTVIINPEGSFSSAAKELNQLGHRPHPLKKNQDSMVLKIKEERSFIMRIGIAGAAAGNIMIYAVSIYAGAPGKYAEFFNLLSAGFAIPVFTYSAFPFYQNALNALKNRTLSIDIPISLSLILGAGMGFYNLLMGVPDNYFDSLTTLVFFLLLSRYFLHKIQEKGLSPSDLHFFYHSGTVLKAEDSGLAEFKEVHPRFIQVDDILKILPGEFLPADGVILSGRSKVNNSLLTGESFPLKVSAGDSVFSGTQNLDRQIIIKVQAAGEETRLGQILKNVENGWAHRSEIVNVTNRVSKYFTLIVFLLSMILFHHLLLTHSWGEALEGAITLLIVTCPCALALSVPLTFRRALSRASQEGIIIKSDEVIERIAKIKNIFIDKTGTLTHGKLKVSGFHLLKQSRIKIEDIIFGLEMKSNHPVANALKDHVKGIGPRIWPVEDFEEILGQGVRGRIQDHFYEINKDGIFEDGELLATFNVSDTVRADSAQTLKSFLKNGFNVKVISGDKEEVVQRIAREVGLPTGQSLHGLSPEEKKELISSTPFSMMIGDGANDAIAIGNAHVGVAVMGAMDMSLKAADVYLTTPGLVPVENLFILSQETMKVIHRNLIFSLIYNSLSVAAAFAGIIHPLVAAVIMPASSLTVLFSTLIGTSKMRNLWKS